MRSEATILHLDLDAFFASVEQRDKPSLRGKPVVVGGVRNRGVVSTASYEARAFGVHSAMPMSEARRRCPHAAFLAGRFDAYQRTSRAVMGVLRAVTPLVEPLSLDEAYVDLAPLDLSHEAAVDLVQQIRADIVVASGGLTASAGLATSKLIAKIASDMDKPDGLVVVQPGTERDLLRPLQVGVIPGVGPATAERLRMLGVTTVEDLWEVSEDELVRALGQAHGHALHRLGRAEDDRAVVPDRETKSVSVEGTYESDLADRPILEALVDRQAHSVAERLRKSRLSGRTVTLKVRLHDFTTNTRSVTLASPVDDARAISKQARALLADVDVSGGVRLLGVGVSSLADWIQDDLFGEEETTVEPELEPEIEEQPLRFAPGMDVVHPEFGAGWVWGAGRSVVTVRFETAETGPGPVRSFPIANHGLHRPEPPADDSETPGTEN